MKKMLKTLAFTAVATLVGASAFAGYGWYDGAMSIGGVTTDCTAWSTDANDPTELGDLTDMTISSIAFNVWSDSNDRGGANMGFRVFDENKSEIGVLSHDDFWLGASTRIEGKEHDFAISWTGTQDLAATVGLTLEHGKVYYIDMWAKTYGNSGDEWYSGTDNYHAKLVYRTPQTVKFDVNDGGAGATCPIESVKCGIGGSYAGFEKPEWANHKFLGWFDDPTAGTRIKMGTEVTEDAERTLYAHWSATQTVNFDLNDGGAGATCSKESTACVIGGKYSGFPAPVWENHKFLGWYDAAEGGTRIKGGVTDVTSAGSRTLYAHWAALQTVNFNLNDGGEGATCSKESVTCNVGGNYAGFPAPVWANHKFLGWFDAAEGGARVKGGMPVTDDAPLTLYAHWRANAAPLSIAGFSMSSRAKAGARAASTVTDTLNYAFTGISGTGYAEWSGKKSVSEALYAGQSGGQYDSIQLRSNNSNSGIVTTKSGGKAKKVTVTWEGNTQNGRTLTVYGKNSAYSQATDLYNASSQGTSLGTIVCGTSTELTISGDYEFIGMRSASGAMYLSEVKIDWEVASSDQSVTLSPAGPIEAEIGDEVIITATAGGFSGDVTWSWTGSGTPDGNRFTVDTSAAFEAATITATATYGTETASQSVTVTVTAPKHAITIDSTIQNGTVTTDPEDEAAEGSPVTVTASPASGYKLGSILVNGSEITGTTFEMPAEDVTVSATFVEKTGGTVTYTVTGKSAVSASGDVPDGSSATYSQTYGTAQQATAGNSFTLTLKGYEGLKIVGLTLSMRSNGSTGAGNLSVTCGNATIASIATAGFGDASWHGSYTTSYVDVTPSVTATTVDDDVVIQIAATQNSLYCESYTVEYETVPVVVEPTVTVTASATEVFVGTEVTITATAEYFDAPASDLIWEWKVGTTVDPTQEGTTFTWTPSDAGTYTVTATATDGDNIDDDSVTITVSEPVVVSTYTLVANKEDFVLGAKYLIVANVGSSYHALKNAHPSGNNGRIDAVSVTRSGTSISASSDDIVWQIEAGAAKGQYVLHNEVEGVSVYAAAPSSDSNAAQLLSDDTDDYAQWTIAFTEGSEEADIASVEQYGGESRLLQRNNSSAFFATYKATQKSPSLYRLASQPVQRVTFEVNGEGATCPKAVGTYLREGYYSEFEKPVWEGHKFLGWFTDPTAGTRIKAGMEVSDEETRKLYAHWVDSQTVYFNVNDNGGGATCSKESTVCSVGGTYSGFPTPVWEGHKFLGWFDAATGGTRVKGGQPVTSSEPLTLYAHWQYYQLVTFNPNGDGATCSKQSVTCAVGGTYPGFPAPVWADHKFLGWYDAAEGGERVKGGKVVTDAPERPVFAHWKANAAPLAISGFSVSTRAAAPAARAAAGEATVTCTLWVDMVADVVYEILWTSDLTGEWTVLKRWTASDDGEFPVTVEVPAGYSTGFFSLDYITGE